MITIGFGGTYYTLWDVTRYQAWTKGRDPQPYWATTYQYFRNLSMDLESAKVKAAEAAGEAGYNIDTNLHGQKWFILREEMTAEERKAFEKDYTFTFGKMKGADIRIAGQASIANIAELQLRIEKEPHYIDLINYHILSEEKNIKDVIWQLERAMKNESTARRKVYARRRLIELGALVRKDWFEKVLVYDEATAIDPEAPATYIQIKRKWMPKGLAKWHEEVGSKKGLWYSNGKRLELTLTATKGKMIATQYGVMYIVNYTDQDNHVVTYKGGTPPKVAQGCTFKCLATINHKNEETFIQRLKLLSTTD